MAPESSTGKPKNKFSSILGRLRPGLCRSSQTPGRSTAPTPSKPSTAQQATQQHGGDPVKTAWKATEVALRVLEKSADAFPPLKAAAGVLVACLDLAKNVTGNQEEYIKLAEELAQIARALKPYASQLAEEGTGGSIALILKSIDEELVKIKKQQERSKGKKIVEAADDKGDILMRYRKIDSLFRRLLSDVTLRTHVEIGKLREATDATLLRTLSPVDDARYNSAYSTAIKRRGCTSSTREQILDDLRTWAKDPIGSRVFWMNGMAGTGKTTILYSFCEWLEENDRMAGNFFCSRTSTACRDLNNIVRSIAYQLAHYSPAFRSQLCKILEEKQNPHTLNVGEQFKWVVAVPLENSKDAIPDGAVIVIDALDECDNVSATALLLKVLMSYAPRLPIKFLVASRPEPVILKNMQTPNFAPSILRLHDIEQSLVEADIKLYLQEALSTVSPAPTSDVIDQLTRRSGKLFIYAATVARYINPEDEEVNAETRLYAILGISTSSAKLKYQELDELYMHILFSAFATTRLEEEELKIRSLVLRSVICAIEPMTTCTMSTILGVRQGDVSSALSRLRSVIHVQEGPSGLVSVLHASFPDFLFNKARSREFYCNIVEHNIKLAHSCFDVMCKELHFNMCNLESSYDFDEDVPDLKQRIKAGISAALLYACKYWSTHLVHCDLTSSIHYRLVEFLKFRLLFWMEVLNLTKSISIGSKLLSGAITWFIQQAPDHTFKETEKELYDADLFVKAFFLGECKKSTPHIYISALPFCYKSNSVYQNYWSNTHGLIVVNGTSLKQQHNRPVGAWTSSSVSRVVFSPDGSTFASGTRRGDLYIRDVQSGEIVFSPLVKHGKAILSVVFSPDNCKIAAGSENGNIWIWDMQTANLIAGPLNMEGGKCVSSLAFSWDSRKLASYAYPTVLVWDSSSGKVLSGPFIIKDTGHINYPSSLAFTPDDSNILLVSNIGVVHILDAHSGSNLAEPFETNIEGRAEAEYLWSSAISPDGTLVAVSYHGKKTIYIWDIHARTMIHGPFAGHSNVLLVLSFSPDGKKLIWASTDRIIRVWDIEAGSVVAGPFAGHTSHIPSLALSSDGTKIISGSYDGSVRIWNVSASNNSNIALPFQCYPDQVAWSPDGTKIASGQSGAEDGKYVVAVWSAQNGEAAIEPIYYSSSIESIAFSPDSSRISAVTLSKDVVSWDSMTGEIVGEPFRQLSSSVDSIAYSPDGSIIATAFLFKKIVTIWDCSRGKMIGKPLDHNDMRVRSVAFTPDGNKLVSGVEDGSLYVWNVHTGQTVLGPIVGHTRPVSSVACSPEKPRFVSGSEDGTLSVWSLTNGEMTAGPFDARFGYVQSVIYSRDGSKIIAGYLNGGICILDAETCNILTSFLTSGSSVSCMAVSPDDSYFVSGSTTGQSLRLWQLDILSSSESVRNAPTIWMPEDDIQVIPITSNMAKYHDDGWVALGNIHIFWTPLEFCDDLCHPYNPITIGRHGTTRIDYSSSKLFIGRRWSKCWIYGRQDSISEWESRQSDAWRCR
ncbi:hypothetical protein D9613_008176 [Agrocybe pediades]|uniref:Nephrocystin 3-like N-terminal domain-containing protein n=1 Tax=Agrocybe pediades TaxID=84607 RepID=A0A8H4QMX4_9AGAR|nr:hypothetical protein D9613_008176 [Agrocybe pediades]